MEQQSIDISSLKNAVNALGDSIAEYDESAPDCSVRRQNALRSGVIHNFETAYELCWKFMKKWLEMNISPDIVKGVTRKEFYRIAWENGLISDVKEWWSFHEARNETSHIYNATIAENVFNAALNFIVSARKYITILEKRI
jgi:nucleotidyltransferase substrate binding protein (TIGR01987 family)